MVLALPIVLVLSRILLQYEAQIVPAARNLLGR
jgi:hypothetical protein